MTKKLKKVASKELTNQVRNVGRWEKELKARLHISNFARKYIRTLAFEHVSTQGTLARENVSTQDKLSHEYVSTEGTLARKLVSKQGTLTQEHVSTQGTLARKHLKT